MAVSVQGRALREQWPDLYAQASEAQPPSPHACLAGDVPAAISPRRSRGAGLAASGPVPLDDRRRYASFAVGPAGGLECLGPAGSAGHGTCADGCRPLAPRAAPSAAALWLGLQRLPLARALDESQRDAIAQLAREARNERDEAIAGHHELLRKQRLRALSGRRAGAHGLVCRHPDGRRGRRSSHAGAELAGTSRPRAVPVPAGGAATAPRGGAGLGRAPATGSGLRGALAPGRRRAWSASPALPAPADRGGAAARRRRPGASLARGGGPAGAAGPGRRRCPPLSAARTRRRRTAQAGRDAGPVAACCHWRLAAARRSQRPPGVAGAGPGIGRGARRRQADGESKATCGAIAKCC
jgi:hypothetical protein